MTIQGGGMGKTLESQDKKGYISSPAMAKQVQACSTFTTIDEVF